MRDAVCAALLHCKKGYIFSRPRPGCHLPNSLWPGIIYLFPAAARPSLVSDIPDGDGKIANFFLQCTVLPIIVIFLVPRLNWSGRRGIAKGTACQKHGNALVTDSWVKADVKTFFVFFGDGGLTHNVQAVLKSSHTLWQCS